jgi:hypothetical protein
VCAGGDRSYSISGGNEAARNRYAMRARISTRTRKIA